MLFSNFFSLCSIIFMSLSSTFLYTTNASISYTRYDLFRSLISFTPHTVTLLCTVPKKIQTHPMVASHAVVFRGLVLLPPHKRLLTQAPHSFPIVLLPKHPSQSPSRHCLTISNQIAGFNGRFRFPRALYSLWYSLERCRS